MLRQVVYKFSTLYSLFPRSINLNLFSKKKDKWFPSYFIVSLFEFIEGQARSIPQEQTDFHLLMQEGDNYYQL